MRDPVDPACAACGHVDTACATRGPADPTRATRGPVDLGPIDGGTPFADPAIVYYRRGSAHGPGPSQMADGMDPKKNKDTKMMTYFPQKNEMTIYLKHVH
jgi:hypothetical protein